MKYIYDTTGNRISIKFIGTEEEFKLEFGESIFISDIDFGDKAIIEDGKIRGMTRYDLVQSGNVELLEGEYMEGKEIKYKEKPDNFHLWDKGTNEWVYDQELEKSSLEEELGTLEGELSNLYDELDKAVERKLKMREKQLNEQIEQLKLKIKNKYKRLEELESEG